MKKYEKIFYSKICHKKLKITNTFFLESDAHETGFDSNSQKTYQTTHTMANNRPYKYIKNIFFLSKPIQYSTAPCGIVFLPVNFR